MQPHPAASASSSPSSSTKADFGTLWAVRAHAGEPVAVIRVNRLHVVLRGAAKDAWGRACKPQPLDVSAELSFARPFGSAAAADRLGDDTVHYGNLAKAILASLAPYTAPPPPPPPTTTATTTTTSTAGPALRDVVDTIWLHLTGRRIDGSMLPPASRKAPTTPQQQPFLSPETMARVRFMSIRLSLPMASLLGEEVSLTASAVFDADSNSNSNGNHLQQLQQQHGGASIITAPTKQAMFGLSLGLHRLRVPTLLGVNENERSSKQLVVATVELDRFDDRPDIYTVLENMVVTTLDSSSFETLEALGTHIAKAIFAKFNELSSGWQIRITLEKPTALALAECPVVEIRVGPN